MKLSKTVKILLTSLGIITIIGSVGISTIVKNNREESNKLEQDRLEQKINDLEEQLNENEQENIENENEQENIEIEEDEKEAKDDELVSERQISAMDMYNKAVDENAHLPVNRFYNYYMVIYGTIENNYNNYSPKDMYEVSDKFLNLLYADIKDHGSLSDELLQEQRSWVEYKLNNFDENDYSGLYTYTMNRCKEFIEMYN